MDSDLSAKCQGQKAMKRGTRILVVDDQVTNFDIIEGFLMILGFTNIKANVDFVNNGSAALSLLEKAIDEKDVTRYNLVLIESKMPLMDGFETIKRMKHLYEGVGLPKSLQQMIVATTCMSEQEHRNRANSSNFDQVLPKPICI